LIKMFCPSFTSWIYMPFSDVLGTCVRLADSIILASGIIATHESFTRKNKLILSYVFNILSMGSIMYSWPVGALFAFA
jgi:hypothetical protein